MLDPFSDSDIREQLRSLQEQLDALQATLPAGGGWVDTDTHATPGDTVIDVQKDGDDTAGVSADYSRRDHAHQLLRRVGVGTQDPHNSGVEMISEEDKLGVIWEDEYDKIEAIQDTTGSVGDRCSILYANHHHPFDGTAFADGTTIIWAGGVFSAVGVPAGSIVMTGRAAAPTGWLLCQGQAVSRTTYSDLFTAIGTAYGAGDGSTTFNLPDLQARFPLGKSGATALGDDADVSTHKHTGAGHAHAILDNGIPVKPGGGSVEVSAGSGLYVAEANHAHDAPWGDQNTESSGTGDTSTVSHMPPYQVVNFMIKT